MSPIQQMLLGAGAVVEKRYIDDIFSQFLYAGNGSSQSINNGIDLAGEGGMILLKSRDSADASGGGSPAGYGWGVHDTVRGKAKNMQTQSTAGEGTWPNAVSSFNSNGFTLGDVSYNYSSQDFISFSFKKAPGFFDCVSWTGSGNGLRQISHSLGSVPGAIFIKRTDAAENWIVWHRSVDSSTPEDYYLKLNSEAPRTDRYQMFNDQAPTSTYFVVGTDSEVNASGGSYIAYIFGHDDQSFGNGENQSVIKCSSYSGNGSSTAGTSVDLGWQPQFILVKRFESNNQPWELYDTTRGLADDKYDGESSSQGLSPNTSASEGPYPYFRPTSKGFQCVSGGQNINASGGEYIFIAIRFPDGAVCKPPTAGTDVFSLATGTNSTNPGFVSGFPVDFSIRRPYESSSDWISASRLTGIRYLKPNKTNVETYDTDQTFDYQNGIGKWGSNLTGYMSWQWKRHAGFEVIVYDGVGGGQTLNHQLSKIPEMIWIKNRDYAEPWTVGHKGLNGGTNPWQYWVRTNASDAEEDNTASFNDTAPTATQFTVGNDRRVDFASQKFIALLFASVENISKCGFYDGSENAQTITVGFQPRFILIKRTTSGAGGDDWVVADSVRGISAGNDEILYLNLTDEQASQNLVGVTSTGFTVVADYHEVNHEDHKYIYYCHA